MKDVVERTDTKKGEKTDIATGLVTTGKAFARELGSSLVEAAQAENRKVLQGQVLGKVQELLMQLQKQRRYLDSTQANIALLEQKVKAVEAGEFTVSSYGVIAYTDKALDKAVTSMVECVNCGHSARQRTDGY
jgi:hypothetical protein